MSDIGLLRYFLGITVSSCSRKVIQDLLARDDTLSDPTFYLHLVERLIYLAATHRNKKQSTVPLLKCTSTLHYVLCGIVVVARMVAEARMVADSLAPMPLTRCR